MKSRAIVVKQTGGPEVLQFGEVEVAALGPGEASVRHRAIGLKRQRLALPDPSYAPDLYRETRGSGRAANCAPRLA